MVAFIRRMDDVYDLMMIEDESRIEDHGIMQAYQYVGIIYHEVRIHRL